MTQRPAIIVAATPTSNGDLHLGHMAGPYLSGDVYARYLAATGRDVVYTTITDDSQTYVSTTAQRQGLSPEALRATSTDAIAASMRALGIGIDGMPPIGASYRETVLTFVERLHRNGSLRLRKVRMPVARATGQVLFDGFLGGTCPACLAGSSGGVCEGCGHPNHFDQLLDAAPALDPGAEFEYREYEVLVLPLEEYRERLRAYYDERRDLWRPHARQLIQELLAGPLPDVPVTVPGDWGLPAPFAETPGQRIYPWIEAMPAVMYASAWVVAQREPAQRGPAPAETDDLWRRDRDAEIVYFHGYDNVYYWGLVDLALLMAHDDRYALPATNVCNEFYELDGQKFSTSRNHLVWTRDLLDGVPRDVARFYLALTAPEFQRSTFTRPALRTTTGARLIRPWNELAAQLAVLTGKVVDTELPTTENGRLRAKVLTKRFAGCYELATFSMGRAAAMVADQLDRLRAASGDLKDDPAALGDLLLEVRALLAGAAPLLVDVAARAEGQGVELRLDDSEPPESITVFTLPALTGDHDGTGRS